MADVLSTERQCVFSFLIRFHVVRHLKCFGYSLLLLLSVSVHCVGDSGRIAVPGTWCSIIPPPGFIKAQRYRGFDHPPSKSSILVSVINSSLESNLAALDSTRNPRMRMQILRTELLRLPTGTARLFVMPEKGRKGDMIKQMLVVGDSLRTVSISGFSPASDTAMAILIRSALETVVYDANDDSNPLAVLPFTFGISGSGFRPAQINGKTMLLARGSNRFTGPPAPLMVAGTARINRDSTDLKTYAVTQCMKVPGVDTSMRPTTESITLDSLPGFRLSATTAERLLLAMILFDKDGRVFLMAGTGPTNIKSLTKEFDTAFSVFRRREEADSADD